MLKNIEMMNELLRKSQEIRNNQVSTVKESKEEMLRKATVKIREYFEDVIKVLPFKTVNVTLDYEEIMFLIRNDNKFKPNEYEKGKDLCYSFIGAIFITDKGSYGSTYYSIDKRYEGGRWGSSRLHALDEKAIMKLVNNFDKIKNAIENEITKLIDEEIKKNAKVVNNEADKISSLEGFLN
jgi:hypothetical protein